MKKFLLSALQYLNYPSTWSGLVALLTLAGVKIDPAQAGAIGTAGIALYGVIHVFFSDADVAPPAAK